MFNIVKFGHMTEIQEWKFYYKFIHQNVPVYFQNWNIATLSDVHSYETRGRYKFIPPKLKYNISICTIKHRIPNFVNKATENIKEKLYSHSLRGFVTYLKWTFVSLYSNNCNIPNCYVCHAICLHDQ